jgi:hypothetical protein
MGVVTQAVDGLGRRDIQSSESLFRFLGSCGDSSRGNDCEADYLQDQSQLPVAASVRVLGY